MTTLASLIGQLDEEEGDSQLLLLAIADLCEETGRDREGAAWRWLGLQKMAPNQSAENPIHYFWSRYNKGNWAPPRRLAKEYWAKLRPLCLQPNNFYALQFPSRVKAFLVLVEALVELGVPE